MAKRGAKSSVAASEAQSTALTAPSATEQRLEVAKAALQSTKSQAEWLAQFIACDGDAHEASRLCEAAWFTDHDPERVAYLARECVKAPHVAPALEAWRADRKRLQERSKEAILGELALIGFSDPARAFDERGNLLPLNRMPPEVRRAVRKVRGDGSVEFHSKTDALGLLGKNQKLFTDSIELNGSLSLETLLEQAKTIEVERAELRRITQGGTDGTEGASVATVHTHGQ